MNIIDKSLFHSINISAQGLSVQRTRMNVVSENIANVNTTRTENGEPYRRKLVQIAEGGTGEKFADVFQQTRIQMTGNHPSHRPTVPFRSTEERPEFGVHVSNIVTDPAEFKVIYDPAHPDANEDGYVKMPNINYVQEMIDLITATRSFEANVTALNSAKEMIRAALRI
jgi:flagellar basal-body rod protein FlgC